jgi:hypothetical protein
MALVVLQAQLPQKKIKANLRAKSHRKRGNVRPELGELGQREAPAGYQGEHTKIGPKQGSRCQYNTPAMMGFAASGMSILWPIVANSLFAGSLADFEQDQIQWRKAV